MSDRHASLVCTNRGHHRRVILLRWLAPAPVKELQLSEPAHALTCRRCRRNPRPGVEMFRALMQLAEEMQLAEDHPTGLDLSYLDL